MKNRILVGSGIAPLQHALKLLVGPRVQIDGLDSADMCAHTTVNTRASASLVSELDLIHGSSSCSPNADEDAQIPTGPSRVCRHLSASVLCRSVCISYACSSCSLHSSCFLPI